MQNVMSNVWVLALSGLSILVVALNMGLSIDLFGFLGGFGGFLTGLFTVGAVIVVAMLAGWIFQQALLAISPRGMARELRTAPLTASFGMLMIVIYINLAVIAPVNAPFSETEEVGPENLFHGGRAE